MRSGNGKGQIEFPVRPGPNREKFSDRTKNPLFFVGVTQQNVILTQKLITLTQNVIHFSTQKVINILRHNVIT